jgi:hypothetical protein
LEKWILDVQLPTLLIEGFTAETPIAWCCRRPYLLLFPEASRIAVAAGGQPPKAKKIES